MRTFVLIAGLIIQSWLPAHAELIQTDDPIWGGGSFTTDTSTGLSWLSPTATVGISYQAIRQLLAADSRYVGLRVASTSELELLYSNALIPDVNVPGFGPLYGTTNNVEGVRNLQALVGVTYRYQYSAAGYLSETAGFVGDDFVSPVNGFLSANIGNLVLRTAIETRSGILDFASAYSVWGSLTTGTANDGVGTWLVREVPEPSTLSLLLSSIGLLVLSGSYRARRNPLMVTP